MKSLSLPLALRFSALLGLMLLLSGCASFDLQAERDFDPTPFKTFFVVTNSNDNRAMDRHIAAALRARGYQVEVGPRTMMPDDNEIVVTYQDQWAWDFADHLASLRISMRPPEKTAMVATASLASRLPLREPPVATVNRLLDSLFAKKK